MFFVHSVYSVRYDSRYVSLEHLLLSLNLSQTTTPCRKTGVTLHSRVRYKEIQAHTCCGPLFSSVKPDLLFNHPLPKRLGSALGLRGSGSGFEIWDLRFGVEGRDLRVEG